MDVAAFNGIVSRDVLLLVFYEFAIINYLGRLGLSIDTPLDPPPSFEAGQYL
jgi:hypothetical protein